MTQKPHPALDPVPAHIGLARLAAALIAWDTTKSSAMAGAGAVGGRCREQPGTRSQERHGTERHQQDPPGEALT